MLSLSLYHLLDRERRNLLLFLCTVEVLQSLNLEEI